MGGRGLDLENYRRRHRRLRAPVPEANRSLFCLLLSNFFKIHGIWCNTMYYFIFLFWLFIVPLLSTHFTCNSTRSISITRAAAPELVIRSRVRADSNPMTSLRYLVSFSSLAKSWERGRCTVTYGVREGRVPGVIFDARDTCFIDTKIERSFK